MIRYACDKCGAALDANDPQRFIVRIEVYAAAGHIDLDIDSRDTGQTLEGVLSDLAKANPDEIEDRTYRRMQFDVCDTCRKALLQKPLG